jgi:hypothetical protein
MTITGGLLVVALIAGSVFTFMGDDDKEHVHDGTVVNCTNSELVMTDEDGTQSTHLVTSSTRVTRDGEVCEARDLISGTRIRVTTEDSREGTATAIEAFVKYATTVE